MKTTKFINNKRLINYTKEPKYLKYLKCIDIGHEICYNKQAIKINRI